METRATTEHFLRCRRTFKFQNAFAVEARGLSGGMRLLRNQNVEVQIISATLNFIHVVITVSDRREIFECTFVYGNPTFQHRTNLWDKIISLHSNRNIPWCCIGDFNEMLSIHDKDGLRPIHQNRVDIFRDFLDKAGLMDFELKGYKFTRVSNPRNGVVTIERIDRVLVNWGWRFQYPQALGIVVPIIGSHCSPITLCTKPKTKSGVPFKFEAFWEEHEDCNKIIEEGWQSSSQEDSPWVSLLDKTKACKKSLHEWHRRTFKRANEEIWRLKGKLNWLLNQNQANTDWDEVNDI